MTEKTDKPEFTPTPEELELLTTIQKAVQRLTALGWNTTLMPPEAGDSIVVEAGSTGVFRGRYLSERSFFIEDGGDLWPSRPLAWKRPPER